MRLEEGRRIVGTLIPGTAMDPLIRTLKAGAESSDTYIQEVTIDDWAGENGGIGMWPKRDNRMSSFLFYIWKVCKLEIFFRNEQKKFLGPGI